MLNDLVEEGRVEVGVRARRVVDPCYESQERPQVFLNDLTWTEGSRA